MQDIVPFEGWALNRIAELDLALPGFAGAYLRASAERRQVIAAFLSLSNHERRVSLEVATFLMRGDHEAILLRASARPVRGFRRALAKGGAQPHEPEYYRNVRDALCGGPRPVVNAIMQADALGPERLEIIQFLPDWLCDQRIIARLNGKDQAADLVKVIELMVRKGIDRTSLVNALLKSKASLRTVVQRWSMRIPFPVGPIPASRNYRPIANGGELRAVALRYQNCSRRYMVDSLAGENAFGEYTHHDDRQALVCFNQNDGMWSLDGAYVRRNRRVADDLNEAVRQFSADHGVVAHRPSRNRDDDISALRRFNRSVFDW